MGSASGVRGFEGSGGPDEFVISGCLDPHPIYEKILTGFLRFTRTTFGSSGGP